MEINIKVKLNSPFFRATLPILSSDDFCYSISDDYQNWPNYTIEKLDILSKIIRYSNELDWELSS